MRKILLLSSMLTMLFYVSCTNEDELNLNNEFIDKAKYSKVISLINEFSNTHEGSKATTRALNLDDMEILNIKEGDYSFDIDSIMPVLSDNSKTSQSITVKNDEKTTVKIYTIEFIKNGQQGYAIATTDKRINDIYYYAPFGQLSDTLYNEPLRALLNNIRNVCQRDLQNYYINESAENATTRASGANTYHLLVNPIVKLEWNQNYPYNMYVPVTCNNLPYSYRGIAPAGCTTIACAQVLAYLSPSSMTNYVSNIRLVKKFLEGVENQPYETDVGNFVNIVGNILGTNYDCNGSGAQIKNLRSLLNSYGIKYEYTESDINLSKLAYNLWNKLPHLTSGFTEDTSHEGHSWFWEGIDCYYTKLDIPNKKFVLASNTSLKLYCNWGWGGSSNGWYRDTQIEHPANTTYHFTSNNCQLYITQVRDPIPSNSNVQ